MRKKQNLPEMFPPVTREYVTEQKEKILASDLTADEKIRSLELLKVEILVGHNPVKFFREFRNFCKSV